MQYYTRKEQRARQRASEREREKRAEYRKFANALLLNLAVGNSLHKLVPVAGAVAANTAHRTNE